MADSLRKLAAELARVRGDVRSLQRWSSTEQLRFSSLDDGSVPEKDATGQVVSRWGKQEDGTHGVVIFDGPVPPVPTTPTAEGGPRSITAIWDGTYAGDVGKHDFRAVEFYAAPGPFSYLEEATLIGSIHDPDGGRITVARPVGDWHIGALTLSAAGRRSGLSGLAVATSETIVSGEDLARLEKAFTTSDRPPTPEDGEGRPDGAYWTMLNAAGEQAARWRWDEGTEQWVETPLAVEFIPEAYIDFLAANTGFIRELESEIIRADTFQGQRFIGGTFEGTRFEGAEIEGGELSIPGALAANPDDGVLVGGELQIHADPPTRTIPSGLDPAPLMGWATLPASIDPERALVAHVQLEAGTNYPYGAGQLQMWYQPPNGSPHWVTSGSVVVPPQGQGASRSIQFPPPPGGWNQEVRLFFVPDEEEEQGTGDLLVTGLRISQSAAGNIEVSGRIDAERGSFSTLEVGEINTGVMLLDSKSISGVDADANPPELVIPAHLRGAFRKYVVEINGAISGAPIGATAIGVLPNGRFGSNHLEYWYTSRAELVDGTVVHYGDEASAGWPHMGYLSGVGWTGGIMRVTFDPRGPGTVSRMSWESHGWSRASSAESGNGFLMRAGGYWTPPQRQQLTHFMLRPSTAVGRTWSTSSTAQLWGYR